MWNRASRNNRRSQWFPRMENTPAGACRRERLSVNGCSSSLRRLTMSPLEYYGIGAEAVDFFDKFVAE